MNRERKFLTAGLILAALSVIFTVLVCTVDVQPIGLMGTNVGFATVNGYFAERFPYNSIWYTLSQGCGALALITAAGFAVVGVIQLIQGKSLKKVDPCIIGLGVLYIVTIAFYILFDKLALNYRPVDLGEGLEPSYPSSHVLLVGCAMGSAIFAINRVFGGLWVRRLTKAAFAAILVLTVAGRMLSGVHWFTDIVGGLLISASLVLLYGAFYCREVGKKKRGR